MTLDKATQEKLQQLEHYLAAAGELLNQIIKETTPAASTQQSKMPYQQANESTQKRTQAAQEGCHKISELREGMKRVKVCGELVEVSTPIEIRTGTGPTDLANAVIQDATGTIKLPLWGEQTRMFHKGDRVTVENGYVNSYKGTLQLNAGTYGTIERVR